MGERIDLTGQRFGRLTVLEYDHMDSRRNSYWRCLCDCGNETTVRTDSLKNGNTTSCGCYRREHCGKIAREFNVTHDMYSSPLYAVWRDMRHRCISANHHAYFNYGGRGIRICDEWNDFENFKDWALDNGYEEGLSIDRINNDDGYYPENCRWADRVTQCNNRRNNHYVTWNNITHTIAEWLRMFGVNDETLRRRINNDNMRDFEEYFKED